MFDPSAVIFIIALSLVSLFLLIKWRVAVTELADRRRESEINELILSASIGGHYYWDAAVDSEYFSLNLVKTLNFHKEIGKFEEIAELFKYDGEALLEELNRLKEGAKVSFLINSKAKIMGKSRYFHCSGNRVDGENGEIVGCIVWFIDITEYINELKNLTDEKADFKRELEKYQKMIDALPMPVWQRGKDFTIETANLVYSRYVDDGGTGGETGKISELDEDVKEQSKRFFANNKRPFHTKKHIIVEGERRYFDISEIPMADGGILGFGLDISKQEEIEKELSRHMSAHADLLESSSSAMAIYGKDMKLKFYNNAFVKLWGIDEKWLNSNPTYGEVLEMLRENRMLPEQANFKKFRDRQTKMFKDLINPHNEFFYLPDGRSLRVIVIPHALGGLLFAYEDMTDRLAIERSYNTLMAVQKETVDNLREGIIVIAEDGKVKLYNPMFNKLWPKSKTIMDGEPRLSDVLDKSKTMLYYNGKWESFKKEVISGLTKRSSFYKRVERKDNKVIDVVSVPLPDGANLISFVDVTDSTLVERSLRERNDALEEGDRIKTEFLANVSYELRTPLTTIMGFSETLESGLLGSLNKKQEGYIHGIYDSANELMSLINDILDLASIEAGYMKLEIEKFDVYEMLESVVKLLKERCREVGLKISLNCDKKIGKMLGDKRRMKQIIFNILSNSIKFTPSGGEILVGARVGAKGNIDIWVSDNGIGIKEEDLGKIFNRFFKTEDAIEKSSPGAGLGLSVVRRITEIHGGEVCVESKYGKGTKVTCSLKMNNESLLEEK